MSYKTRLDFGSNNRQAKQHQYSEIILSGKTTFGVTDYLIPPSFTGDTINIEARQYIKTKGLIIVDGTQQDGLVLTSDANGKATWQSVSAHTFNDYVTETTFNATTGDLTSTRLSGGTIITNLDGRYLTSETDSQTLSFSANTGDLEISNGNVINLDGRYQLSGATSTQSAIHTQSGASTTWVFTHNLNVLKPIIQVWDENDDIVIPQNIRATDVNTITITFSTASTGSASAMWIS